MYCTTYHRVPSRDRAVWLVGGTTALFGPGGPSSRSGRVTGMLKSSVGTPHRTRARLLPLLRRVSRKRTERWGKMLGTAGAARRSSCWRASPTRSDWGTCGGSRTCARCTAEVSQETSRSGSTTSMWREEKPKVFFRTFFSFLRRLVHSAVALTDFGSVRHLCWRKVLVPLVAVT